MKFQSMFSGDVQRSIDVSSIDEIREASVECPLGDGWGQRVRGAADELRSVGAYEAMGGGWLVETGAGYLFCEPVEVEP